MKLPENNRVKWNYVGLAFVIPTALMLIVYIICGYEPFGKYSLLYSDMYHQYYPFFYAFRKALLSGESLLWNWSAGMGMDYLGLISYYLASPLNLLSVLVPEPWVLEYFCLLMPIKLGIASGFFAIMLKKLFGNDDLSITLFGCFYGMCAWALGYQWNIMWLDTFALLPLVMLGTVQLLRDKKFILYTVTLFLSVFANYYVGFFVCIFVFLFFFCYEICRFKGIGRFFGDLCRIGFFSILAIGMTAILELPALAALQNTQSSVNTYPEGFAVNIVSGELVTAAKEAWNTYKTAKEAGEETFALWWTAIKTSLPPLLEAMQKVSGNLGGGLEPTFKDGLPNIYCGVFPVALGFLFLMSKDVRFRDKLCSVLLLTFFGLSFILRQLDYIWHGFHFTNQIPYRFSFLYSFVILYMAYRAWLLRNSYKLWQVITAGILSCGLLLWSENRTDGAYLAWNLAFLGLYLTCMGYHTIADTLDVGEEPEAPAVPMEAFRAETFPVQQVDDATPMPEELDPEHMDLPNAEINADLLVDLDALLAPEPEEDPAPTPRRRFRFPSPDEHRRYAALAIAAFMALELVLNVANFSARFPATYAANYPRGTTDAASMIKVMQELEDDTPFYRAEVTHSQTLNDGALNGYNGISTFTSSANVKVTEFMEQFGFAAKNTYNRYLFEEASPVANLFLGIKYMIDREGQVEENSYFDVKHVFGNITLLENNAYLPLGFLAESSLADFDFYSNSTSFKFQNAVFKAATGLDTNVWVNEPGSSLTVTSDEHITKTVQALSGYCNYSVGDTSGKITYTYTIAKEGFLCLDMNLPKRNSFSVYKVDTSGETPIDTLLYTESISLPQMFSVCEVKPGDTIKVVITCAANESTSMTIRAAVAQKEVFQQGYDILNASTLRLSECTSTYISGVIDCNRDGLLYTSIPQDGNWTAYVDGEIVEAVLVGDVMLSIPMTEGTHTVEFRYTNAAFEYGALISLGCAAVFGGIVLGAWLARRKKKGTED